MPGIKYLPKYDEFGNVKQIKMYDDYGREAGWVDYTDHGDSDISSPHYHTILHWHERIYNAQNRYGMKINHRTDTNTPLGDKVWNKEIEAIQEQKGIKNKQSFKVALNICQ